MAVALLPKDARNRALSYDCHIRGHCAGWPGVGALSRSEGRSIIVAGVAICAGVTRANPAGRFEPWQAGADSLSLLREHRNLALAHISASAHAAPVSEAALQSEMALRTAVVSVRCLPHPPGLCPAICRAPVRPRARAP